MSRTNNYIPFEIKSKDSIYHDSIFYPFDMKMIGKHSSFILSKAKTYIVNRAGESFFKNIELESIEVNYPKNIKVEYENLKLFELDNYDVKYWVLYTYKKDTYKYAFGLLLDKKGNMISENVFPDISKKPLFENYINPCIALNLARSDKRFINKKIDYIELAYVDELNTFCWLIQEDWIPTKLGVSNYELSSFYVNANSAKIEKVIKVKRTSIACGFGSVKAKE
jgi:hypothetical protein